MAIITTITPVISANSSGTVWSSGSSIAGTTIGPAEAEHVTMPPAETLAPTGQLQFALTEQAQSAHNRTGAKRKKRSPAAPARGSKTSLILKALHRSKGATIAQLTAISGWQPHSVRGFLSGTVRKKLGLSLASEIGEDGQRRYRIVDPADMAE